MKIYQILTFFKEHIDILNSNKTPSQEDIVEIRLKRKDLFCPRCRKTLTVNPPFISFRSRIEDMT